MEPKGFSERLDALRARCESDYDEGLAAYDEKHPIVRWICKLTVIYKIGAGYDTDHIVYARDPDGACYEADAWAFDYYRGVEVVHVTNARRA